MRINIKWNWGVIIVIVFLLFVFSVFFRVYLSYQREVDIISTDYYPKGIDFETEIQKRNNSMNLPNKPIVYQTNDTVFVKYPIGLINNKSSGNLFFYCPSNINNDFRLNLNLVGDTIQKISKTYFRKGKYIVTLDWKTDNKEYSSEVELSIK